MSGDGGRDERPALTHLEGELPGLHQNLLTNSSLVQGGEMDLNSSH